MSANNFKLSGVDIFVEVKLGTKLPESVGIFNLKHIASRGLKIAAGSDANILDIGWVCARYTFSNPPSGSGDKEIGELIATIGKSYNWTSLIKLYDDGGKPAYT